MDKRNVSVNLVILRKKKAVKKLMKVLNGNHLLEDIVLNSCDFDAHYNAIFSRTKKNALILTRKKSPEFDTMQKSIENRCNSLKILTKLFETFCPLNEWAPHFETELLHSSLEHCAYVAIGYSGGTPDLGLGPLYRRFFYSFSII
jgi:hypothetical protein